MNFNGFVYILIVAFLDGALGQHPRVSVREGILVGRTVSFSEATITNITKDVDVFQGVPYADPPTRFQPPLPKAPWDDERNATSFKPACFQALSFYFPDQAEDCLYLNVYAPHPKPQNAAVMVYIHGGGFSSGSAMVYDFYGVPLVAIGDVIVVVLNYRLGVFGKFTTRDEQAPGNIGMLDQVAALEWVNTNIGAFGGDPDRITIFGESAGSASVNFHQLSKLSHGLFTQAILQSGTAFSPWAFQDSSPEHDREIAQGIGAAVGCDAVASADLVQCLQSVDPRELWTEADQLYGGSYPIIVDGTFLDDTPQRLYDSGDFKKSPILAGFTQDEGTYYLYSEYGHSDVPPPIDLTTLGGLISKYLGPLYSSESGAIHDAVYQEYVDWTIADNPAADFFQSAIDFLGDWGMKCPTDAVVRAHAAAGDDVYLYNFAHRIIAASYFFVDGILLFTPWLGASHAEELLYVWGSPFIDELNNSHGVMTHEERALSVNIMTFWTNFAKTGNAEQSSHGETWPSFTIPELRHIVLEETLEQGRAARASQCRFWNEYLPKLKFATGSIEETQNDWREGYLTWKEELDDWKFAFEAYKNGKTCS